MNTLLTDRVCDLVRSMPCLKQHHTVALELDAWLRRRVPQWQQLVEEIAPIVGYTVEDESVVRVLAAWLCLLGVSSPLDNYVDGDMEQGSAWTELGRDAGTFLGIALICDSFLLLSNGAMEAAACQRLIAGTRGASSGQVLDVQQVKTIDAYDQMVVLKSSSLFIMLVEALAALGQVDAASLTGLQQFAHWLGIAVQIMNDYRGIRMVDVLGKVEGGDLRKDVMTYPILVGLHADYPRRHEFEAQMALPGSERNVELLWELMEEAGVRTVIGLALAKCRVMMLESLACFDSDQRTRMIGWYDQTFIAKA